MGQSASCADDETSSNGPADGYHSDMARLEPSRELGLLTELDTMDLLLRKAILIRILVRVVFRLRGRTLSTRIAGRACALATENTHRDAERGLLMVERRVLRVLKERISSAT